jgi:hypothetical protein
MPISKFNLTISTVSHMLTKTAIRHSKAGILNHAEHVENLLEMHFVVHDSTVSL